MNRTRRTIGLSILVVLIVLGTGWALERASIHSHPRGVPAAGEPEKPSNAVITPVMGDPVDIEPISNDEYDRSDLVLSQG